MSKALRNMFVHILMVTVKDATKRAAIYRLDVDAIVAWATELAVAEKGEPAARGWRVPCPLCQCGPDNYEIGFLLPGGLRCHLEGSKKAHLCPVVAAQLPILRR